MPSCAKQVLSWSAPLKVQFFFFYEISLTQDFINNSVCMPTILFTGKILYGKFKDQWLTKSIFKAFADLAKSLSFLNFYPHLMGPNQDKNEAIFFALGTLRRSLFQRSYEVWSCKCSICTTNRDIIKNCRITLKCTLKWKCKPMGNTRSQNTRSFLWWHLKTE